MRQKRLSCFGFCKQHCIKLIFTFILINVGFILLLSLMTEVDVSDDIIAKESCLDPGAVVRNIEHSIMSRSMVLLATHRMNQIVDELKDRLQVNMSCSK